MNKLQKNISLLFFCITFSTSAMMAAAAERTLIIFGDSWAEQLGENQMEQELRDRQFDAFITVDKRGISGSRLSDWVDDDQGLLSAITADPNPNPIVFFILGGNDILQRTGTPDQMAADLETIVARLHETRDDLQIVYGGYDILNPNVDVMCNALFAGISTTADTEDNNGLNNSLYDLLAPAQSLVSQYPRLTVIDTFGSLQGEPGNPDFTQWSSAEYIADCIHLNNSGYGIYLDTIFNDAITPLICADNSVTAIGCDSDFVSVVSSATDTPAPATVTPPLTVQQAEDQVETRPTTTWIGFGLLLSGAVALIASLVAGMYKND